MPLAWPRAPAYDTWRLTLILTGLSQVLADHHHYYHASPLSLLNPWLSACDIATPNTAPDLVGPCKTVMAGQYISFSHAIRVNGDITEGPGPPPEGSCPRPCPSSSHNASQNQCLHYFHDKHRDSLCYEAGSGLTAARLSELRLRHCCEHSVAASLLPEVLSAVLSSSTKCSHYLGILLELDLLASRVSCEFGEILSRFDCVHQYSVKSFCSHCQVAYRRWVCSNIIPHFPVPGGSRLRPCRAACRSVEQKCPFFLPNDRAPNYPTQYAGEPTFLCQDPKIPESGDQLQKSSYGEESCCYNHCTEATGLPGLCPTPNSSCVDRGTESMLPAGVCEPPPPAPTPPPGDRTLPSACAPSIPSVPPRPSAARAARGASVLDSCLIGLVCIVALHQVTARVGASSPARKPSASHRSRSWSTSTWRKARSTPWSTPWSTPRSTPRGTPRSTPWSTPWRRPWRRPRVRRALRRKVSRLGIRTTTIMSSLFCSVEHVNVVVNKSVIEGLYYRKRNHVLKKLTHCAIHEKCVLQKTKIVKM